MLMKISPLKGGRIMTPAEISRFFAGRDTVCQHHGFAALMEDYAKDRAVERHCDKELLTKGDSL
jgi:hypothetical protein